MKREEKITLEYLKAKYGENVIPIPEHQDPPDILVNSSIAVEVRRLNQHFFENGEPEGLENLSFSLVSALEEVLESFDNSYDGISYWVFVEYKRPLNSDYRRIKKEMRLALLNFLNSQASNFSHEISVNPEITFLFLKSEVGKGKLFLFAGSGDFNAGGWVIQVYVDNIRHCIDEKSSKISERLENYHEWWLYLVDCMELGLDRQEFLEVAQKVGGTGSFDRVVVLDYHGENALAIIQR
jgi:hypothetical protein